MEIVFLGTGTSHGVPMIGCNCEVCTSEDPRNRRMRTSIHVRLGEHAVQVDIAPEFRLQCIQNNIEHIDWVVMTHGHADHIAGMDDLRRFVDFRNGEAIPVFGFSETLERVRCMYPYAVRDRPEFRGYPAFVPIEVKRGETLEFPWGTLETTVLPHGRFEVMGLVFNEATTGKRFAYYTDCKRVGPEQQTLAAGSDLVVLDGLRADPHPTHMSIDEAVEVALAIGSPQTFLIHMTHHVDFETTDMSLPDGVNLAYDGLHVKL
ncbi:MAG: MBL fold metallo-hydrolase [Verrucomicrobiae bacterium]|nr:MBL fold metallo-hydrolase [Verrucomicrobiae bacterium]